MMEVSGKNPTQNLMEKESRPCRVNGNRLQTPEEHPEHDKQQANEWPVLAENYIALYSTFPKGKSLFPS